MDKLFAELAQGSVLVCATRRQARHWRWRFDQHQRDMGRSGWLAPAIHAWGPWLSALWEQSLLAGGRAGSHGLLDETQADFAWRELIAAGNAADRLAAGTDAGLRAMRSAWRVLHEWGIDHQALEGSASTPDELVFAQWARRYREFLAAGNWLDPVQLPALLAEDLDDALISAPKRLYWLGWSTRPPVLEMIDRALSRSGCQTLRVETAGSGNRARRETFSDRAAEQRAMVSFLAEAVGGAAGRCHGLILAEPSAWSRRSLRERVLDRLEPAWRNRPRAGLPVNIDGDLRLADTGPAHAALLLLNLASSRIDYRKVGQLLRSPYLAAGETESAARARLDLRVRAERQPDLSLGELLEIPDFPAPRLREMLLALRNQQRDSGTARDPGDWVSWIEALLAAAGWPGDRELNVDEEAAIVAWQALLERFGSLGSVSGRMRLSAVQRWLEREAAQAELTSGRRENALQILSIADAQGLHFDSLWMPGLHAEAWPCAAQPDPLLPLDLQRRAGLPDASPASHAAHSQHLVTALLHRAGDSRVSCALSYDDRQCTPSPVLAALPAGPPRDVTPAPPPQDQIQWSGDLEILDADPVPPVGPGETVRGGSRLLQLQGGCPSRAFMELRLGAEEVRVPAFGIDAVLRGQLLHSAVDVLYEGLMASGLQPGIDDCEGKIDAAVETVLENWARSRHPILPLLADIERRRLVAQLRQLMRVEAARPPFRVVATEQPGTIQLGGLQIELRLDRLDRLQDDSLLVIDYKTGRRLAASAWAGERLSEPQLPLYAIANRVDGIAVVQINADGVAFRGVCRVDTGVPGMRSVARFSGGETEDWEELRAQWRRALTAVAEEFAAGSCMIDTREPGPAQGQYAPLTRVHSLPDECGP